jgi:predicted acetyltransferase
MPIEIRNASPGDYEAAVDVITTAFMERPDNRAVAESMRTNWDPDRVWLAFDADRVVGTLRSFPTEVTIPGGRRLPAAAVSAVTVLPTFRRRGIMTGLAAREHGALRERGEAAALLYAAEYGIYGRLGYAPGTRQVEYTIDARATRFRGEPVGTVELVPAAPAVRDACAVVFDEWRLRQPGEIRRRETSWDRAFGLREEPWGERWKGFVALHRDASGVVDGYVRWKAEPKWERSLPMGVVEVNELHALTDTGDDDLLRFLLGLDLLATVRLPDRRESERFPWLLTNARATRVTDWSDGLWVRLFDVPRALEARSYERSGSVVLEVVDDPMWGGTSRLLLEAGPDGATCRPTDRAADLTVPVAALSGAYLGGTRLAHIALSTGYDEHRPGALHQADDLLRTADLPWCTTHF